MRKAELITFTYTVTSKLTNEDCDFNEALFRTSETEMIFSGFNEAMRMEDDGSKGVHLGRIDSTTTKDLFDGQQLGFRLILALW